MLLEHSRPGQKLGGFTDNYLRVETDLPDAYDNNLVAMRLDTLGSDGETVAATLAE